MTTTLTKRPADRRGRPEKNDTMSEPMAELDKTVVLKGLPDADKSAPKGALVNAELPDDAPSFKLSLTELSVGAMSAVASAMLGSRLGVAGTLVGAAVGSVAFGIVSTTLKAAVAHVKRRPRWVAASVFLTAIIAFVSALVLVTGAEVTTGKSLDGRSGATTVTRISASSGKVVDRSEPTPTPEEPVTSEPPQPTPEASQPPQGSEPTPTPTPEPEPTQPPAPTATPDAPQPTPAKKDSPKEPAPTGAPRAGASVAPER